MIQELNDIKQQHINSYKKALLEIVQNNTNILVNEDILSLFKKPPLDSMDIIKAKFLDLAKKNSIVLNTVELSKIIDSYRSYLSLSCSEIKDLRLNNLISIIKKTNLEKNNSIIKLNKKDFMEVNKNIKKIVRDQLVTGYEKYINSNLSFVFQKEVSDSIKEKMEMELSKFLKKIFQKQILESLDIKILVKDTILINTLKEQGERYLFTLNNSRLLNDIK